MITLDKVKIIIEGRKAKRVPGASNEKPTGSFSRGTLKDTPEGQKRYKAAKIDIEVKKGLRDAGASGDFSPTMSPEARKKAQAIRDARIKNLQTPDPFDDDYAKKTGKVDKRTKVGKKIGSAFESPKKSDFKKLDKKPGGYRAPKGDFGPGITKGQANVKGMERRTFKITKPSDVEVPQSFKDFDKKLRRYRSDLQDYKDRDKATMRTGESSSKVKVSGANNLSRQDVGMAPSDTPKKTKPQKGVSALETTKKYNQERASKASKNTMPSGKDFISKYKKQAETATTNLRKKVNKIAKNKKLTGGQKAVKSREVMKNVKTSQNFARGYANPKKAQTAITLPKDIKTVKDAAKGARRTITKTTKKPLKVNLGKQISFGKSPIQKAVKALNPRAADVLKTLGPGGRKLLKRGGLAGALGLTALSSPTIRRGVKAALAGAGLATFANKKDEYSKQLKLGDGIKAVGPVKSTYSLSKPKFDKGTKVSGGYVQNPKDVAKMKEKRKNYTPTKK